MAAKWFDHWTTWAGQVNCVILPMDQGWVLLFLTQALSGPIGHIATAMPDSSSSSFGRHQIIAIDDVFCELYIHRIARRESDTAVESRTSVSVVHDHTEHQSMPQPPIFTARSRPVSNDCTDITDIHCHEPQSRFARLWLDMIIAQSDAHNFDAARSMLNSNADTETATQLTTPEPTPNLQL